jgi:hypothetical protein
MTPTDPHVTWFARYLDAVAEYNATPGTPEYDDLFDKTTELENLIFGTPATTLAGVVAQVWLVLHGEETSTLPADAWPGGIRNILATVERLAGGAATQAIF